ncbi:MAG: ABC transporter permease [Deltaproteobacteria bacterium]|nr:ABC transporter permease [Deltaproteobacteria bacterium]
MTRAGLGAVVRKELRQIGRDRRLLPMLIFAPLVQLMVFGHAVSFDIDNVDVAVCDLDDSAASRTLARRLVADGTFQPVGPLPDCTRPEQALLDGRADVAVLFPAGLERDLAAGRPVEVQVLVDGTNPTIGRFASVAAQAFLDARAAELQRERLAGLRSAQGFERPVPTLTVQSRLFYNPRMQSAIFMVPGVAAMLLLLITTVGTAMGIARERELGTLEQVMVTPLRPAELILGKVAPFVLVGLLDVVVALVVSSWMFDVPIRGSLLVVFAGTLLYLLSTVGLGLFISTVSSSQQQAFMVGFFVMMPAILLSGFMTPVENMPDWLQPIAWVNPVRYYVEVLRGALLKAAGFRDLGLQFGALAAFGTTILAASIVRFRKRLA